MSDLSVPCTAVVRMAAETDAQHRCPFVDEVDHGTVHVEWTTTAGQTLELHALAALIAARAETEISHEQWTADLAAAIASSAQVDDLIVTSHWTTAGVRVAVTAPLPLEDGATG